MDLMNLPILPLLAGTWQVKYMVLISSSESCIDDLHTIYISTTWSYGCVVWCPGGHCLRLLRHAGTCHRQLH